MMSQATAARILGIAVFVLVFIGLMFALPAACRKIDALQDQAKIDRGQGEAFQNSSSDAVETQSKANQREAQSEAVTRANEKEIRDAEGASDKVNPAVRDAGLRGLCRRAAYRDDPRCRVQPAPTH